MNRRKLLTSLGAGAMAISWNRRLLAQTSRESRAARSIVYKRVDGCELPADVWEPADTDSLRPVLIYLHGGALIMGNRSSDRPEIVNLLLPKGYVIVSLDYRLAPETKLPGIIEDLRDALRWVREQGPMLFKADPNRIAVHGVSAGGYLTLMSGFCVEPRWQALISYYGYGDIIGDWLVRPDAGYMRQRMISHDEALSVVGKGVPPCGTLDNKRFNFYLYCRQTGRWPAEVTGLDPQTDRSGFKPYCPLRNVTPQYPPTLLCHGMKDADVPYEQSSAMADELTRVGVAHELIPARNADHGFAGASPRDRDLIRRRTVSFLEDNLSTKTR